MFVDLGGGIDGLLHITDISWSRITNPSEVLSLGQEIDVKILSFDKEKKNTKKRGNRKYYSNKQIKITCRNI